MKKELELNESAAEKNPCKEFIRKGSILRSNTTIKKNGERIARKQSEEPFRRMVNFADKSNLPLRTVIDFEPFKYEKEYLSTPIIPQIKKKSSKGCHCLVT